MAAFGAFGDIVSLKVVRDKGGESFCFALLLLPQPSPFQRPAAPRRGPQDAVRPPQGGRPRSLCAPMARAGVARGRLWTGGRAAWGEEGRGRGESTPHLPPPFFFLQPPRFGAPVRRPAGPRLRSGRLTRGSRACRTRPRSPTGAGPPAAAAAGSRMGRGGALGFGCSRPSPSPPLSSSAALPPSPLSLPARARRDCGASGPGRARPRARARGPAGPGRPTRRRNPTPFPQ